MSRHRAPQTPPISRARGDNTAAIIVFAAAATLIALLLYPALVWTPPAAPAISTPAPDIPGGPRPDAGNQTPAAQPMTDVAAATTNPPAAAWPITVQPGDTLTRIAAANNEPLTTLEADNADVLNGRPDLIRPGLVLIVR